MKKYIDYAKAFNANNEVLNWIEANLSNYLIKNSENQTDIEHIIDYLVSEDAPKRLKKMSYEEAKKNADKWIKKQIKKGSKVTEGFEDIEVIKDFNDGFKIVKLIGEKAFKREGHLMSHCVSSYFGKNTEVYSLRDHNNMPHCTMEKDQQVKGKGNGSISPKYIKYIVAFLEEIGMTVGSNEMKNLGYIDISDLKEELHKTKNNFYNEKYIYEDEELIGKDGNKYQSMRLWDFKPLLNITETNIKINFELPSFLKASFEYMSKSMTLKGGDSAQNASSGYSAKNASSGYSAKNASSGNSAQNASSGNSAKNASSGDSAQNASSGNSAKNASSGDSAQNASSGNSAQNASSGYYAKNASSGNSAKNASSGDSAQNASSGYYAQNASSGNSAKNASSGYSAKNASSGYSAKNASSGNSAQNASSGNSAKNASSGYSAKNASSGDRTEETITGKNSVCAAIGRNSKIKAIKGTWITLAEYDKEGIVKLVKSAQIDGKELKENVFYQLIDGNFKEVE